MTRASITLPGTTVAIPPLGLGTWAWGDKSTWGMGGYDSDRSEQSIREAWDVPRRRSHVHRHDRCVC